MDDRDLLGVLRIRHNLAQMLSDCCPADGAASDAFTFSDKFKSYISKVKARLSYFSSSEFLLFFFFAS